MIIGDKNFSQTEFKVRKDPDLPLVNIFVGRRKGKRFQNVEKSWDGIFHLYM
jgi:hypothetical protein